MLAMIIYYNTLFSTISVAQSVSIFLYLNMSFRCLCLLLCLSAGIKFRNMSTDVILRHMQKMNYESE